MIGQARENGLDLTVEVETKVEDTYPVPWSVVIRGQISAAEQAALSQQITQDLGIPEERQEWWSM